MVCRRERAAGEVLMRITTARKLVRYWQEILGLTEWTIADVVWGEDSLMGDSFSGFNDFFTEGRKSKIILNRRDADDEIEETIVHELLHLMIDGHKGKDKVVGRHYDPMHELALNRLAKVFVALDREGKKWSLIKN